jgi:histidinol-phosphate aminotransferase
VRAGIAAARESRARLTESLRTMGMHPFSSAANFVLVPVADAAATATRMRAAGVAVRPFSAMPGIGDAVRITVAPWPMMETALQAFRAAVPR